MVDLSSEVSSEWSGDARIKKRLSTATSAISKSPAKSFPKIFTSSDELEAFYRLLRNPNIGWHEIFQSHAERTVDRITGEREEVLCLSDTTTFSFVRENGAEDIGYIGKNKNSSPLHRLSFTEHFGMPV